MYVPALYGSPFTGRKHQMPLIMNPSNWLVDRLASHCSRRSSSTANCQIEQYLPLKANLAPGCMEKTCVKECNMYGEKEGKGKGKQKWEKRWVTCDAEKPWSSSPY